MVLPMARHLTTYDELECPNMTIRPSRFLGLRVYPALLGSALLAMATACGGSSFKSGGGESSSGGSSTGGTSSTESTTAVDTGGATDSGGGPATGGSGPSDTGGMVGSGGLAPSGGAVATGGAATSGGINATGGASTVGTSPCQQNSDCTICKYERAVSSEGDCYCATCPTTPMSRDQCDANRNLWEHYCSQVPMVCPAIACVSRLAAACSNGVCVSIMTAGG